MIVRNAVFIRRATLVLVSISMLVFAAAASAASEVKLTGHIGRPGERGEGPGEFEFPRDVTVLQSNGDIYVADGNFENRIQKFDAEGKFIFMIGREVNETKDKVAGSNQSERNICTASSKDVCGFGLSGSGPGEFANNVRGLAVEEATGDLYAVDFENNRVQKFDSEGKFLLMFGGEVNTNGSNVCGAGETCQKGIEGPGQGDFQSWEGLGKWIAVGSAGASPTVYVGDKGRIEEFEPDGTWKGDISLAFLSTTGEVKVLTVDSGGNLYVVDGSVSGVHEISPSGNQIAEFDAGSENVSAIALDPSNDVVVIDHKTVSGSIVGDEYHGVVYWPLGTPAAGGVRAEFGVGSMSESTGMAYNEATVELYVADDGNQDVEIYEGPVQFAEAITGPPDEVLSMSARLLGEVNPQGFDASSFFEYGPCGGSSACQSTAYGSVAPAVQTAGGPSPGSLDDGSGLADVPVEAKLTGLLPNESYHYRLVGHNVDGDGPAGREEIFMTQAIPPDVETLPPLLVGFDSAIFAGSVNPEHSDTVYRIEYGICQTSETCPESEYTDATPPGKAAVYAPVEVVQEVYGLHPSSTYHYRLVASDGAGAVEGQEQTLRTGRAPALTAISGSASQVTQTSAVLAGTVDPKGVESGYGFELGTEAGVYGPAIGVGRVEAGVHASTTVTLAIQGLTPGTTYHYRLVADSAYASSAGGDVAFTTPGIASVITLPPPSQVLPEPLIVFPSEARRTPRCSKGRKRSKHGKCVKRHHAGKTRKHVTKHKPNRS